MPEDLLLGGRYRVGAVLAHGGMAVVHRAWDDVLGRDVAVKLFPVPDGDTDALRRYEAEVALLATVGHPHLVTLLDAGTDDVAGKARSYLVMELIDGPDLRTRLQSGPLAADDVAAVGAGVASALAYIHGRGILHRDVKPANILLLPQPVGQPVHPKLTDFGIARSTAGTRLTATGAMMGTAAYLSPEQVTGAAVGPASDVYSLGLVLLEALTGKTEYPGSPVESTVARLHRSPLVPEALGTTWTTLLTAMTARSPEDRPTPQDVAIRLGTFPAHHLTRTAVLPVTPAMARVPPVPAVPPATSVQPPARSAAAAASTPSHGTPPPGTPSRRRWRTRIVLPAAAVAAVAGLALLVPILGAEPVDRSANQPTTSVEQTPTLGTSSGSATPALTEESTPALDESATPAPVDSAADTTMTSLQDQAVIGANLPAEQPAVDPAVTGPAAGGEAVPVPPGPATGNGNGNGAGDGNGNGAGKDNGKGPGAGNGKGAGNGNGNGNGKSKG